MFHEKRFWRTKIHLRGSQNLVSLVESFRVERISAEDLEHALGIRRIS
jgi:hypothetical protein